MSNPPNPKKLYLCQKGSDTSKWSRGNKSFDPSNRQSLISSGKDYKRTVAAASTTGVGAYKKANRTAFWAIIEVDENIDPPKAMTDQELQQYVIVASG